MSMRVFRVSKPLLFAAAAFATALTASAQAFKTATEIPDSRADVYLGYGYFHPVNSDIGNHPYQSIYNQNGTLSISGYFNRYLGLQVEGAYFSSNSQRGLPGQCVNGACSDRDPRVYTAEAGPIFRYPLNRWVPYMHLLGGGARIAGPVLQPLTWGWGITGGVGVDYILPYFHNRFAVRPIQADFQYSQVDYGPQGAGGNIGGFGEIHAYKLSGGLVARFGVPDVVRPVEIGCTTQPGNVYPGEPVVANASVVNLKPGRKAFYTWTSTGGKVTPNDSSATIDTTSLGPGDYTVGAHMAYGSKAKDQATCTAPFTVKSYEPPTITCSANPANPMSGATVIITAVGISPQNRPLTYSYSTSGGGQIISSGPTARLSTAGLDSTSITVTCNAVDDLGKTATTTTLVTVQKPAPPIHVETQELCSVSFERHHARPVRVDNEAKECLDSVALTMNQKADAQLIIIGNSGSTDTAQMAAERALNIRQYFVLEKGIDTSRIYVRTGGTSGRNARLVLVPAGATFSSTGTQTFDEGAITRHGQAYGKGAAGSTPPHKVIHHRRRAQSGATAGNTP